MSSVFFRISDRDYIEASRTYGRTDKQYGVRIISFQNGMRNIVYLPEMSLDELTFFVALLHGQLVSGLRQLDDLQNYLYRIYYY
jgi:hypothetical protein